MGNDRMLYATYRQKARYCQKPLFDEIDKIEDVKRRIKIKKAAESYGDYVDDLFRQDEEECIALRQQVRIFEDIERNPIDFLWEDDIKAFRNLKLKLEKIETTYEEQKKVLKEREEKIRSKKKKL